MTARRKGTKTQDETAKIRPKLRGSFRSLGGGRVAIEGFGRRAPAFITIAGGDEIPQGAWLPPSELRRLIKTARRILK